MHNESTILKVEGLSAGYGQHHVLRDVSFDLANGEVLAIIGQNGSGKSTLLKSICGLLPLQSGRIWIKDKPFSSVYPHKLLSLGVSYFAQGGLIMQELSVVEHLRLAMHWMDSSSRKAMEESLFHEFPVLADSKSRKAGNLSGGERQMLSLAMLVAQKTDIWLLDEPVAGLSPELVRYTTGYLKQKTGEGISILLVEHNMDVALNLATYVVVAKENTLTRMFTGNEFRAKDFLDNHLYN